MGYTWLYPPEKGQTQQQLQSGRAESTNWAEHSNLCSSVLSWHMYYNIISVIKPNCRDQRKQSKLELLNSLFPGKYHISVNTIGYVNLKF